MSKKKRYPARIPRAAAGIRAQGTRAGADRCWWAKKWREALERMGGLMGRFGRGRNYASSGQIISLKMEGPRVEASVMGSRPRPYDVSIVFREPDEDARSRIVAALRSEPMLLARLAADDLPMEVEAIFKKEGFDLFPGGKIADRVYDVTTKCSCPDWANPCKHSIAVLIVLGEECRWRPSTLLELRGIDMEELCDED